MFNYDVKFITCEDSVHLKHGDFKSFKYEGKKKTDESVHSFGKRSYCERRGGHYRPSRPRQIKQLESKLRDRSIVKSEWMNDCLLILVFSSGAIAYLTVKPNSLDVTKILFDSYCVGKLSGQTVTGVVLSKSHMLFTHTERTASLITFGKTGATDVPCRICDREPHIQALELGGAARRTERRLSHCETNTSIKVLVWSTTNAEPAPWSPVLEDHANLHMYQIQGQQISLVAYHQMEGDTLSAELSSKKDNNIHIVEQIACHKKGASVDWVRYEVRASERVTMLSALRESVTRASLPSPARCVRRSPCDTTLLVACIDGSLHLLHHVTGLTHSTKAGFIATDVRWSGEVVVAAEEGGRLQCFDRALTSLHHHTKCLDLTSYLRENRRLQVLATQHTRGSSLMLASFTGGPLALLRISHPRLLTAWVRSGRITNAVSLLRSLDWESEGPECLWAVSKLVSEALRSGPEGEGAAQAALGAFLAPVAPHGAAALRFAPPVHDLARKFFHHLLRRGRIEKAMSLAVDLCAWDLFADARWAAAARGLPHLAHEAAAAANQLASHHYHSGCSESCSQCSSHSYSGSDDETSALSEPIKTKPPPLPRIPVPTLMPVPIAQTDSVSTSSIRPNLHQYLERDNTIWNTDVRDYNTQARKRTDVFYKAGSSKMQEERINASNFRQVFQTEVRDDASNTIFRYQHYPTVSMTDRNYRRHLATDRGNKVEKNKVKFSDTVTIAVVSQEPCVSEQSARELADSLPLSPPHKYLAAFAPHPPPGTTLDYVEV